MMDSDLPATDGFTGAEWISALQSGSDMETSDDALGDAYGGIQDLLQRGSLPILDLVLSSLDVARMTPEGMLGVLRYSFVGRDLLPSWRPLAMAVQEELARRGIDPVLEMRGLI